LTCTTVSPGLGSKRHYWLSTKKTGDRKKQKFIEKEFPYLKRDEVELMAELNTIEQLQKLARDLGWDDKQIKAEL
jgi:hypothetical protein